MGGASSVRATLILLVLLLLRSEKKRRSMLSWASELQLTGFVLAGKPGLVVAEGPSDRVAEFVRRTKALSWQKCSTKRQDTDCQPVFPPMAELQLSTHGHRGGHASLSELCAWLTERGQADAFHEVFV